MAQVIDINTPELTDLNGNGLTIGGYDTTDGKIVIWINKKLGGDRIQVEVYREDLKDLLGIY